jgi:hypothetical protein
MKLTMTIPTFTGFYETLHSAAIDDEVEQSVAGDSGHFDEDDALAVEAMNAFHYTNEMLCAYTKSYVLRWVEYIQNETDFDTKAEFAELWSPREYNFETDRIFVKVPEETIRHMIKTMDHKVWADLIKERLSPRPGFAPFYSNDVRSHDWDLAQYKDWGPAKLELLCEAWMRSFDLIDKGMNWTEAEIITAMESNGEVHNAVWNNAPEKWVELVNQIDARREAS